MAFVYMLGCFLTIMVVLQGGVDGQQQKLINLKPISLTEEQNYTNFVLFNFSSYLTLNGERLFKVELLSTADGYSNGFNNATGRFRLSGSLLTVNGAFDREALFDQGLCDTNADYDTAAVGSCLLNLKIALYPLDSMSLVSLFLLPVSVHDVNDNRPKFLKTDPDGVLHLTVSENMPARTSLPLEAPVDADSDRYSVNECHIVPNDDDQLAPSLFDVYYIRPSRSLQLIINAPLDRENRSRYSINLLCSDGRFKTKQTIHLTVLDVNDNIPYLVVSQYNLTVPENTPQSNLVKIEAFDLDDASGPNGRLTYALTNTHDGLFRIDPATGWISLTGEGLDYERVKRVSLRVKVEDTGLNSIPVYADVLVNVLDLNDNSPGCQLTYSNRHIVAENRTNSTVWIYEHLLNSTNQSLNLAYLSLFDADSAPSNGFLLSASLISVSYVNTTTLETVHENLNQSTFRLVPIIQDLNNYYYGLQLVRQVDRESASQFDLLVKLADNNKKFSYFNLRVILVDLNDNPPEFASPVYRFYVRENELVANFGQLDARDADTGANARLEFKILDENDPNLVDLYLNRSYTIDSDPNFLFYINPDNGSLSLRGELDRERKEVYVFTVQVSDGRYTNEALVEVNLIDVNDNQPVFEANEPAVEFQLDENQPPHSVVGNVLAVDPDLNSTVEYGFEPAEISRYFRVEPSTGNLITRTSLDAEAYSRFDFTVTARDSRLGSGDDAARLNVTVFINDLNDNPPQIVNPPNGVFKFDLAQFYTNKTPNCIAGNGTTNLNVFTLSSTDADRDNRRFNRRHAFKFAFIRRLSWPFVYEIVKSELENQTANNHTAELAQMVETIVQTQAKHDVKPVAKVNLRSVFWLEADSTLNQVNLTLNQLCKLNWGVYNVSIQVTDDGGLYTEYPVKLFVYNSNLLPGLMSNLTQSGLSSINAMVERWWTVNAHLLAGLKRRLDVAAAVNSSGVSRVADDNGDYIDGITQEYYKFYASSAFSKFNTGNGVLVAFKNLTGLNLTPSSSSIIVLIAGFVFVSLLLLVIITYKHYRSTGGKVNKDASRKHAAKRSKQKFVVNLNSLSAQTSSKSTSGESSSSFNISDLSLKQQSTKDLSASPNLAASKFSGGKKLTSLKTSTSSSSSSSSSASSSNLILYPSQQQKLLKQTNNQATSSALNYHNPTNEQSRYVQVPLKCLPEQQMNGGANSSICDSFTVITSLTNNGGDNISTSMSGKNLLVRREAGHQIPSCISESGSSASPNESSSLTTTVYMNNNATSTPTVLSTFSPLPSANAQRNHKPDLTAVPTTDAGYYGSSDYSDNNSLVKHEHNHLRQIKQQSTSARVPGQYPPPVATTVAKQPPATNSTSSFGSSLLSSPSSSTDSTSSSSDFIQKSSLSTTTTTNSTPVTNLYPGNIYQTNETGAPPSNDVKTYLEKFERIYNSDSLAVPNDLAHQIPQHHHHHHHNHLNTFNSNLNNKHRNSMTTYSYV